MRLVRLLEEKKQRILEDPLKYASRHDKQVEAYEALRSHVLVALFWGNRVGKCLSLDTPILLQSGVYKRLDEIQQGDKIPCLNLKTLRIEQSKVVDTIRSGMRKMYKVTFADGDTIKASEEHEFPVRLGSGKPIVKRRIKELLLRPKVSISKKLRFISPRDITLASNKPTFNPYLLGVILGDGCISKKSLRITIGELEILKRVSSCLLPMNMSLTLIGKYDYYIKDESIEKRDMLGRIIPHKLREFLKILGLEDKNSHTKFIPFECFLYSRKNRMQLLAGLIDTDGSKKEYSTVSKNLALDFKRLVESLGGRANIKDYKTKFRIYWAMNEQPPVSLSRKLTISKRQPLYTDRIVTNIDYIGKEECGDIMVEHNDHTFISHSNIATGNTEIGAQVVAEVALGKHPIIQSGEIWSFCPSFDEQKDTTQKKLLSYLPENKILDTTYLRKGIIRELTIDASNGTGNGRKSKITFKSYEQGREKAQGAGKVLIWFDEEPPKDLFEECFVRQEAGITLRILMTMTPIKGMTWVYDDIYLKTSNADYYVSEADWDDNPWLTEEQKNVMMRGLSKEALEVRKKGKFMRRVGLVCPWFQRSIHVVEMSEIPHGDTFFGIDFGFSNPACGLYARVDYDNNLYIFDGFYETGLTTPRIEEILNKKDIGLGIIKRIGDSAQASDIKQLNDDGFDIEGISKETGTDKENWDEYRARLMQEHGQVQEGSGKPKIYISNKLVSIDPKTGDEFNFVVKEIENLLWEELKLPSGVKQQSTWGRQPKHAIDTLSYILVKIFGISRKKESGVKVYNPTNSGFTRYRK